MRLLIAAPVMLLLLTGCVTGHSSNAGLTVIEYSKETQIKAAQEMESNVAPTLNILTNDCSVLRDQARIK